MELMYIGMAATASAFGVSLIGMTAVKAVGRNPGAANKILIQSIIAIAFAEAVVLYTILLVK